MALKRPWVTPFELKEYSELAEIQNRSAIRLTVDISRAEQAVIAYTHNRFEEEEAIPQPVRSVILVLAESYGVNAVKGLAAGGLKSETLDDYSYTCTTDGAIATMKSLGLLPLLDEYVIDGDTVLRVRAF